MLNRSGCARYNPAASESLIFTSHQLYASQSAPTTSTHQWPAATLVQYAPLAPPRVFESVDACEAATAAERNAQHTSTVASCFAVPTRIPRPLYVHTTTNVAAQPFYISCKMRLQEWEIPPALRDTSKWRYSVLYDIVGNALLMSQTIDRGSQGKLRVALDSANRAWALKCFRLTSAPMKLFTKDIGREVRDICTTKEVYREARTIQQSSADLEVRGIIRAHDKLYLVHTLGQCGLGSILRRIPASLHVPATRFVMHEMAKKLSTMHQLGYVHGDVKFVNALYRSGQILLCDFGATRKMGRDGQVSPALRSTFPAPEQAAGKRFGGASDIWSLGASFSDMCPVLDFNVLAHQETFEASTAYLNQFFVWRASLFDDQGVLRKERLLNDSSTWGTYFRPRMAWDASSMTYILTYMLEPDPRYRASCADVANYFYAHTEEQVAQRDASVAALGRAAKHSVVQRTLSQLHLVNAYQRHLARPVDETERMDVTDC